MFPINRTHFWNIFGVWLVTFDLELSQTTKGPLPISFKVPFVTSMGRGFMWTHPMEAIVSFVRNINTSWKGLRSVAPIAHSPNLQYILTKLCILLPNVQYASSFNMNPNKWMLVNFDCSLMWVRDRFKLTQALVVDPLYLQHSYSESAIDYRVCFKTIDVFLKILWRVELLGGCESLKYFVPFN